MLIGLVLLSLYILLDCDSELTDLPSWCWHDGPIRWLICGDKTRVRIVPYRCGPALQTPHLIISVQSLGWHNTPSHSLSGDWYKLPLWWLLYQYCWPHHIKKNWFEKYDQAKVQNTQRCRMKCWPCLRRTIAICLTQRRYHLRDTKIQKSTKRFY